MRIWAKIYNEDKIIKNVIIPTATRYNMKDFEEYVQNLCYMLDIPQPIMLKYHYARFMEFNNVKFLPSDFIEEVHFTYFLLEKAE